MNAMRQFGLAIVLGMLTFLSATGAGAVGAADSLVALGDELTVGKNRTGETCRLRLVENRTTSTAIGATASSATGGPSRAASKGASSKLTGIQDVGGAHAVFFHPGKLRQLRLLILYRRNHR